MKKSLLYIVICCVSALFAACQPNGAVEPGNISLSTDTLLFDTVFTAKGSATRIVMVRNETKQPLTIDRVTQADGSCFKVNLDGESDADYLKNIPLPAGDSLFLFVRASIDPLNVNSPVLITDRLTFHLSNGNSRTLEMEAFGQDVTLIDSLIVYSDHTFTADKPYLVQRFITVAPGAKATFDAGATFYMHKDAQIVLEGPVEMKGTPEAPVSFSGDRLDDFIAKIPYAYLPGQWSGVYLYDDKGDAPTWDLQNVRIVSAQNGLFCYGKRADNPPTLTLHNAVIHNHDHYGLVMENMVAKVSNSEISNCASYCVYLMYGDYEFYHNTIADYYRHTVYNSNVGLYSTAREDVAAVYVNNLSKAKVTKVRFVNNIIAGVRRNEVMIASPLPQYFDGIFRNNYLRNDTLPLPNAADNVYWQDSDVVFRNDYYADYQYYDFRLDSLSPARGIADPAVSALYDRDLLDNERLTPDAGCYVYTDYE